MADARQCEEVAAADGCHVAGISGLDWRRFLIFNAIGAALWVLVWTSLGYLSGSHIDTIYNDATRYSTYLVIALGALPIVYITRRVARVRRTRAHRAT